MPLSREGIFTMLAGAPFGAYAISLDQTVLFWNGGAQRILGYLPEQVLGRRCYEIAAGPETAGLMPECPDGCPSIHELRAGRIPRRVQLRLACASGELKEVSLTPMVIAGAPDDAPTLVLLFDDSEAVAVSERAAETAEDELPRNECDVPSDNPEMATVQPGTRALTQRELEVLRLVSLGWETWRIADELVISPHTVRNHIRHFRHKLNAASKLEAVVTAIRLGLLPVP